MARGTYLRPVLGQTAGIIDREEKPDLCLPSGATLLLLATDAFQPAGDRR